MSSASRPSPIDLLENRHVRFWLPCAVMVAASLLVYWDSLSAGFIWDDDYHLTENPCIVGPQGFWDIWSSRHARIGPLTISSFYLQHALWGPNPFPFHLVTLLIHALNGVLLWRVLQRLRVRAAWFGALLWCLHPVQVESVAWITELKNTQSGFFYLLALIFFIRHLQSEDGSRLNYTLSVLAGFLAMASKSSTVVLPVMLALCAWWEKADFDRKLACKLAPFLVLSLASAAVSIWTQGIEGGFTSLVERTPLERVAVSGMVFWFYLGNLIWPVNLMFIYPRWTPALGEAMTWLPVLTMTTLLAAAFWLRRGGWRALSFAVAAYFVPLLPVLGLIEHYFLRYSAVGDHFQYLAGMAPLALIAATVSSLSRRIAGGRHVATLILCTVTTTLALLSRGRVPIFTSNKSLWEDSYKWNQNSSIVLTNLALVRFEEGELNETRELLNQALIENPRNVVALYNLGVFEGRANRFDEAVRLLLAADSEQPDDSGILSNLGAAQRGAGMLEEAVATLRKAWVLDPENAVALYNLSEILISRGELDEPILMLEDWLDRHPDDYRARQLLVIAMRQRR